MRWIITAWLSLALVACGGEGSNEPDAEATSTRSAEQTEVAEARAEPTEPSATATQARATTVEIEYVITSEPAAIVSLTYENDTGGTSQEDGVRTPWSMTMQMQSGDFAYVSAQGNEYAAEITCEIWVDGTLGATSTSSGKFVIATCDGTVP